MKVKISNWAWIEKKRLGQFKLDKLKRRLTVLPRSMSRFKEEPDPICMYSETEDMIGVPRSFFLENLANVFPYEFDVSEGRLINVEFVRNEEYEAAHPEIVEEQDKAVDKIIKDVTGGGLGGILRAGCGFGKTISGIKIIAKIGVKTLVVVHKEFLMNQWRDRISESVPDARIGRIQADVIDVEDKDIVLGMMQSLAYKDYPSFVYDEFGMIVIDECHRASAPSWSAAVPRFKSKYRIGLSATPRRKDGTEDVFFWTIGPVLYSASGKRLTPSVKKVYTGFGISKTDRFDPDKAAIPTLLRVLTGSVKRNSIIADMVVRAVSKGRKVLVLSERIAHLQKLDTLFRRKKGNLKATTGFYVGALPREDNPKKTKPRTRAELDEAAEADVVWATYHMISEGYDDDRIDTLVLATPKSDVEQACGRIVRERVGKKNPIVIDFVDLGLKWSVDCWIGRLAYYKNTGAKVGV